MYYLYIYNCTFFDDVLSICSPFHFFDKGESSFHKVEILVILIRYSTAC